MNRLIHGVVSEYNNHLTRKRTKDTKRKEAAAYSSSFVIFVVISCMRGLQNIVVCKIFIGK